MVIGGDGQVSLGNTVMKGNARKVRRLYHGKVIAGFAGGTADAFTLFERFGRNWKSTGGIWSAPPWSWPRAGAPTAPCAVWKPCWPWPTRKTP